MTKKTLDSIKNESGFKTPEDYFSKVEEQILNEVHLMEKVDQPGFEVPESYFDDLENKVLDKTISKQDTKVVSLLPWKKVMYISAAAAVLILIFNAIFNISEGGIDSINFDTLEMASIETYLEEQDYSSQELASLLTDEELSSDKFIDNEISEETIEDYLLDHVEIEDLIIE